MAIFNTQIKGGGSAPAVINSLNVTPSTSAQTITATGGVDGYSPVNVSAVTSSIDANIVAGNIKDGVSILGVAGNVVELRGETKIITPRTYAQTVYPTNPNNGITQVTVPAVTNTIDSNIVAGNIKTGVSILGVTGNYSGTTPTGTLNITSNNTYDVTNYATAVVNVPGGQSGYPEIPSYVVSNGTASKRTIALTGHEFDDIVSIANTGMRGAFLYVNMTGVANFPNLTSVGGDGLSQTFAGTSITSASFDSLVNATGQLAFQQTFAFNANLTSVSFPVLKTAGSDCFSSCFTSCTSLVTMTFTALESIGATAFNMTFNGCTGLTTLSFPALKTVANSNSLGYMLFGCSNVTVHFPSNLQSTVGSYASTLAGYNGTNTTVLFDLPATE
ncbi:MAG: hypothetical protein J6T10_12265 [Methanobrevibacter sp.]|nr:hypothetical protein [Methanobrevibacter sp.]